MDNQWRIDDDSLLNRGSWSRDAIEALLDQVMSLSELSEALDVPYDSLAKAAREGRIQARQSGKVWLSTVEAVQAAIEAGTLRPRNRLMSKI